MGSLFSQVQILRYNDVISTNSVLSALSNKTTEGTIVFADYQTQGRGQGGNSWESESGKNLTFSILLKPNFLKASEQFYISKIISLAVSDLVALFVDPVFIKWPNDIYVGEQKIGGILIENSIEGQFISQSIAGIGVNLNQKQFLSNAPNPISMTQITNDTYEVEDLLDTLIDLIEYRYEMLKNKEYNLIDENYIDVLYRYKQHAIYEAEGLQFRGKIVGVEPTGGLMIQDDGGKRRCFYYKEVRFL